MKNYQQKQNPFGKPNPFHVPTKFYSKPNLNEKNNKELNHLYYIPETQVSITPEIDMWEFNKSNFGKYKMNMKNSKREKSNFERSMQSSCITPFKNSSVQPLNINNHHNIRNSRIENPFYRKNLLVNEEQVKSQVQIDLTMVNYNKYFSSSRQINKDNLKASKYILQYANQIPKIHTQLSGMENENYSFVDKSDIKELQSKQGEQRKKNESEKKQEERRQVIENQQYEKQILIKGKLFYRNPIYHKSESQYN